MKIFTDDLAHTIYLNATPQRIVSLVPSQTELLITMGLAENVVGITKFCIHPKDFWRKTPKIGGTKDFKMEVIARLQPDLIIGNKEENYEEGIERLRAQYPVWCSDIVTLADAYKMMLSIGQLTDKEAKSQEIVDKIQTSFAELPTVVTSASPKVLYLIWKSPYMAAGKGTFIDEMLRLGGFRNCTNTPRYPVITDEAIQQLAPDLIFLSSEPYPFKDKHMAALQALCPSATVVLVDGELFSWYGSRLLHSAAYLKKLGEQYHST